MITHVNSIFFQYMQHWACCDVLVYAFYILFMLMSAMAKLLLADFENVCAECNGSQYLTNISLGFIRHTLIMYLELLRAHDHDTDLGFVAVTCLSVVVLGYNSGQGLGHPIQEEC